MAAFDAVNLNWEDYVEVSENILDQMRLNIYLEIIQKQKKKLVGNQKLQLLNL